MLPIPCAVGKHSPGHLTSAAALRTAVTMIKHMLLHAFLQIQTETMNVEGAHGSFLEHPCFSLYLPILWDLLRDVTVNFLVPRCHFDLIQTLLTQEIKEHPSRVDFHIQASCITQHQHTPTTYILRNSLLPLVMDAVEGLGTTAVVAAVTAETVETLLVESDCITGEIKRKQRDKKEEEKNQVL